MSCVFCKIESSEKVIQFTSETRQKCKTVLDFRRNRPVRRKSRCNYNDVQLPDMPSNDGYHAQCYKLFTAIKIPAEFQQQESMELPEVSGNDSDLNAPVTSITIQVSDTSTDYVVESKNFDGCFDDMDDEFREDEPVASMDAGERQCIICQRSRKRLHGREVPMSVNKFQTIGLLKSAATDHYDVEMLEKIGSFSDDAEITYHKCCKDQYLRDISRGGESDFQKKRRISNVAYAKLCGMLQNTVIEKKECLFFDHVQQLYKELLTEQSVLVFESVSNVSFSDRHLERKLMETFNNKIKIICAKKRKFLAPFSANIPAYTDLIKEMTLKENIRSVAAKLRTEIINCPSSKLLDDCTAEDLIKGECDFVPDLLTCFLETLLWGDVSHLSKKALDNNKKSNNLTMFSLGQDLIYAASGHKIKTSKHITMGLAIKSLCNRKQIINVLSRYGHCCSYTALEEFEAERTFSTARSSYVCPEEIVCHPDLNTAIALNGNDTGRDNLPSLALE